MPYEEDKFSIIERKSKNDEDILTENKEELKLGKWVPRMKYYIFTKKSDEGYRIDDDDQNDSDERYQIGER